MTSAEFREWLGEQNACIAAMEWLGERDERQAWEECERGDWLLWWAGKRKVDRRLLVLAACRCARLALPYVSSGELRPLKAIETAEAWCAGKATKTEVRAAAAAAAAAAVNAAAYAATPPLRRQRRLLRR